MLRTQNPKIPPLPTSIKNDVTKYLHELMLKLWENFYHLGLDDEGKSSNMYQLLDILKKFFEEVSGGTEEELKKLNEEVANLELETDELSRILNVEITRVEYDETEPLSTYKTQLESRICDYRKQVENRRKTVTMLREWQLDVCNALGHEPEVISEDPLPTEVGLEHIKEKIQVLQDERDRRTKIFIEKQSQIKDILNDLGVKPLLKFEKHVVQSMSIDFQCSDDNMRKLDELHKAWLDKLEDTQNRLLKLRERLNRLWECLEVDPNYRSNFLSTHTGLTLETENAIRAEIERCEEIKRQNIKIIVEKIRNDIETMWELCMISPDERKEFIHFRQNLFTEDTLTLHELYYDKLKRLYDENKLMYDLIKERCELWQKMKELEDAANKPGRYNNRGGQLLKEEKKRKTIAAKLPKIEARLMEMADDFEKQNGYAFKIKGKLLSEHIKEDWELRKLEHLSKTSARKATATPVPNTPSNVITSYRAPSATRSASALTSRIASTTTLRNVATVNTAAAKRRANVMDDALKPKLRRKLNMNTDKENLKSVTPAKITIPKIMVNSNPLKNKRRLSKRKSMNRSGNNSRLHSSGETKVIKKEVEASIMTSYSDFKEHLHENVSSRSSVVPEMIDNKRALRCSPRLNTDTSRNMIKKEMFATPQALPRRLPRQRSDLTVSPIPRTNLTRRSRSANSLHRDVANGTHIPRPKNLPCIF